MFSKKMKHRIKVMIVRILNKLEAKLKSSEIARFLVLTLMNLLMFVIAISLLILVGFLLFMNNFTTNFINFIMEWSSKHKNDLLLYGIGLNKIILKIKGIKNKIVENAGNHILENHIFNANYKGFRVTPEMNGYWFRYFEIIICFIVLTIANIYISHLS